MKSRALRRENGEIEKTARNRTIRTRHGGEIDDEIKKLAHGQEKMHVNAQKKKNSTSHSKIAETQTDSDPLIESDTADESGEDDGVSWPSDEQAGSADMTGDDPFGEDEEEIGLEMDSAQSSRGSNSKDHAHRSTAGRQNGETGQAQKSKTSANPTDAVNGNTSRESHAKQKQVAQERKAAKPNADIIARSKKLWERLRRKSHVPLEERKALVAELFEIITGRVQDFVFKHDSVRVVQTALKYANLDQRKMIARELRGTYKTISESKYGKFLVGKIVVHGDKEVRDFVVPEFYGHVRKMIRHPEAAWILDDIYRGAASSTQKAILLREWYGAEFAIFKPTARNGMINGEHQMDKEATASLKDILAQHPEKRKPILESLRGMINLMIQKKTTAYTMLHDAMLQYYLCLSRESDEAKEYLELLFGDEENDLLRNLAFTSCGARLLCLLLAHGSAKDRKLLIKAFKGTLGMMMYDSFAHQVILTALDVIDDTVLIGKTTVGELVGKAVPLEQRANEFVNAANHLVARSTLLYLFCGLSKAFLSAPDIQLLQEMHEIRAETSKKDPSQRRTELLAYACPPLLEAMSLKIPDLLRTSYGCQFVTEVLLGSVGEDRDPVLEALLEQTDLLNPSPPLSQIEDTLESASDQITQHVSRMFKTIIQGGRFDTRTKSVIRCEPPLDFANRFLDKMLADTNTIIEWATNENSFIVVKLLESVDLSEKSRQRLKDLLRRSKAQLEAAAATSPSNQTTTASSKQTSKKRKLTNATADEDPNVKASGNAGSRMLLAQLS